MSNHIQPRNPMNYALGSYSESLYTSDDHRRRRIQKRRPNDKKKSNKIDILTDDGTTYVRQKIDQMGSIILNEAYDDDSDNYTDGNEEWLVRVHDTDDIFVCTKNASSDVVDNGEAFINALRMDVFPDMSDMKISSDSTTIDSNNTTTNEDCPNRCQRELDEEYSRMDFEYDYGEEQYEDSLGREGILDNQHHEFFSYSSQSMESSEGNDPSQDSVSLTMDGGLISMYRYPDLLQEMLLEDEYLLVDTVELSPSSDSNKTELVLVNDGFTEEQYMMSNYG